MKTLTKISWLLCVVLVTGAATLFAQNDHALWGNLSFYEAENEEIKTEHPPVQVVFMGNSITRGWVRAHPSFFKDNRFTGRGIGGQTTPQMLARFRPDVVELDPKMVVINGGINDIAANTGTYNFEYTLGCIKSMAEIAHANGIKVILTSVLPVEMIPWREEISAVPAKIDQLNVAIRDYCKEKGFLYADYYAQMVSKDGSKSLKAEYTTDGVHVTPAGYEVMESVIMQVINLSRDAK